MKLSKPLAVVIGSILIVAIAAVVICFLLRPRISAIVAVDCAWGGWGHAWLDVNENGLQDPGEAPLSNVEMLVHDKNGGSYGGWGVTNPQGEANLYVFLGGCPDVRLEVSATVPAGMRLTTPGSLPADEDSAAPQFHFGFAYLPGVPTPTPRPSGPMDCAAYPWPPDEEHYYLVEDIAIAPDGTVWGTTMHGAFHLDPATRNWTVYTETSGLPSSYIYSLAIAPDGVVWAATYEGIASFDGLSWTRRSREGFKTSNVAALFILHDDIWAIVNDGAYRLDPGSNDLTHYPLGGDAAIEHATLAPDGTIWGTEGRYVSQLIPSPTPKWVSYRSGLILSIEGFAISADGAPWTLGYTCSGSYGVTRFDPQTQVCATYDYSTTNGALIDDHFYSLAAAPDGSLWLGTWRSGAIRLLPGSGDRADDIEVVYYMKEEFVDREAIEAIAFAPDGTIWFGIGTKVVHCVLE